MSLLQRRRNTLFGLRNVWTISRSTSSLSVELICFSFVCLKFSFLFHLSSIPAKYGPTFHTNYCISFGRMHVIWLDTSNKMHTNFLLLHWTCCIVIARAMKPQQFLTIHTTATASLTKYSRVGCNRMSFVNLASM